jgi:REP element-mobilizing transposase RayT
MASEPPRRRPHYRLAGYDYAQAGIYFVTICVRDRRCLFGSVRDDAVALSDIGDAIDASWREMPLVMADIALDLHVVMPNHLHGLLELKTTGSRGLAAAVQAFKSLSTRRVNALRVTPGAPLWQRGYYEHIVRNQADLDRIRQYIADNPGKWAYDTENPAGRMRALAPLV